MKNPRRAFAQVETMGRDRKNENRVEQFTKWLRHETELPAWKALGFPARTAYMHLRIRCFAETAGTKRNFRNNNGEIYLSARKLAKEMGCNNKTAMAAMADLQAKGWIVATKPHQLGVDGAGKAPHFRLTMMNTGQGESLKRATKEPNQWDPSNDFEVRVFASNKPVGRKGDAKRFTGKSRKKQKARTSMWCNPAPECG